MICIVVNGVFNMEDNCKKVAVAFDGVVSSLEVMNCQSIQAQVRICVLCSASCVIVQYTKKIYVYCSVEHKSTSYYNLV